MTQPIKLLLLEDNPADADLVEARLTPESHWAVSHVDSLAALLEQTPRDFDVVVSDLGLPDSVGIGTLESVLAWCRGQTPVVVLTGAVEDDKLGEEAVAAGAQDYLPKSSLAHLPRTLRYARERFSWQANLAAIVKQSADAIVVLDANGSVLFENPAAQQLQAQGATLDNVVMDEAGHVEFALDGHHQTFQLSVTDVVWRGRAATVLTLQNITEHIERQQLKDRLADAAKMAAIGRLSSGMAHHINNPTMVLLANAGFIAEEAERLGALAKRASPDIKDDLATISTDLVELAGHCQSSGARIQELTAELKHFAGPTTSDFEAVDVNHLVRTAMRTMTDTMRGLVQVETRFDDVPHVAGARHRLARVIEGLIENAVEAIAGQGDRGDILIETFVAGKGDDVIVRIQDSGPGMTEEVLSEATQPFFTTKTEKFGRGLGLTHAADIVRHHGGVLDIASTVGEGTQVVIRLPARRTSAESSPSAAAEASLQVLVVDDDRLLLRMYRRMLQNAEGIGEVLCVDNAQSALELLHEDASSVDVIVSDLMMPVMDGVDFYKAVREGWPELSQRFLFVSGGAFTDKVINFLSTSNVPLLQKPVSPQHLTEVIVAKGTGGAASDRSG